MDDSIIVTEKSGIISGKRFLNGIHLKLGNQGFKQVYVDQMNEDVVAVTRHNPVSHQSVLLVARTQFRQSSRKLYVKPLYVDGLIDEIYCEGKLVKRKRSRDTRQDTNGKFIVGLQEYELVLRKNLRVNISKQAKRRILALRRCLTHFGYVQRTISGRGIKLKQTLGGEGEEDVLERGLKEIVGDMNLSALNRAMFRSKEEEGDEGRGGGAYDFPRFGKLVYCGIQGLIPLMNEIRLKNDLGHPICCNIRDGDWLLQYIANRLKAEKATKELGLWYENVFAELKHIPHYLKPCYFDGVMHGSYNLMRDTIWSLMSDFVRDGSHFLKALALATVAFCGYSKTSKLPELSKNVADPKPPKTINAETGREEDRLTSISAGLPHFATGLFRNWGRDTFIALPGCLLVTGRYDEARYIILSFAGTLRHGLIPNLLGEGVCARYNCRDAVWFWLYAIRKGRAFKFVSLLLILTFRLIFDHS